jgi:AcrR family transcriptional regulator
VKAVPRKRILPTKANRERVSLGVAVGLTVAEIAAALGISKTTVEHLYSHEIRTGRAARRLEAAERLDKASAKGNVSATKALLLLMEPSQPTEVEDDAGRWEHLMPEKTQNREFQ